MSNDRLDQLDYYTLLGVEQTASLDEIRAAFRRFALKYHPDRHAGADPDKLQRATAIYRRGSEAFETLVDPARRRAYDLVLARGELRLTSDPQAVMRAAARVAPHASTGAGETIGAKRRSVAPSSVRRSASRSRPATLDFQSPSAKAFYARALEASRAKDYRRALRMIESALEHEPAHPLLLEAKKRLLPYA